MEIGGQLQRATYSLPIDEVLPAVLSALERLVTLGLALRTQEDGRAVNRMVAPVLADEERKAIVTEHPEILVQTEDESMTDLLPTVLALVPGAQPRLVRTAEEVAQRLRANQPDLIVLDLDWPHVFDPTLALALAREAVETVQAAFDRARVPIIGISAELTRRQMVELGLAEGIRKPFDVDDLLAVAERVLAQ